MNHGSVLIIVLWVAFGLVALALYFANSMSLELRAADNRAAGAAAEQAISGVARYLTNVLGRATEPGLMPQLTSYRTEAVPVGEATFWFIGRSDKQTSIERPTFGLTDEGAKLNLNASWVTADVLLFLPRMTPELAAAIVDWRDTNEDVTQGGAESETYLRYNPPYRCKNTNYESVAELRLVRGGDLNVLYGDDANLNGILDANENDGDASTPSDNQDGRVDPGLLDYFTVHSRCLMTGTNVSNREQMQTLLQTRLSEERVGQILDQAFQGQGSTNVLQFYLLSGMTREEFEPFEGYLIGSMTNGLINVNTASEAVLSCVPGLGTEHAASLVAYRRTNPSQLNTVAWVSDALDREIALQAAPYLTGRTFQFSADVAAVGQHGRGYRRTKMILDTSDGTPRIRYRQDLSALGWALGRQVRESLTLVKDIR
jgi:type II secretory pathway component PulK